MSQDLGVAFPLFPEAKICKTQEENGKNNEQAMITLQEMAFLNSLYGS